jgi:hypothetical protein
MTGARISMQSTSGAAHHVVMLHVSSMSTELGSLLRWWQLRGEAPAIQPALALYRELWAEGYTLTLITGRSAAAPHVDDTAENPRVYEDAGVKPTEML